MSHQDAADRRTSDATVDDTAATVLHVDMDAFFASVEILDHPEARGKPAIVAGGGARSVVTSATYEARTFGVRSAMPLGQAMRLCPGAIRLEPQMEKYREYSAQVLEIFREVTPLVEQVSIDEAFLDVAGARRRLGSPATIGALLRHRVFEQTGLPCSVGAATTKFVAKLASGKAKPDGMLVIPASETLAFLRPLPVGALWGVGASTRSALDRLGLRTVGDLADTPVRVLQKTLGEASGAKLHALANGIDPRQVTTVTLEKSVGHEVTFEQDVADGAALRLELLRLAGRTAGRLRKSGICARTVVLKVRYQDFRTVTRSRTLPDATNVGRRIYEEVLACYESLGANQPPVRLIGVRAEQLEPAGGTDALLWDQDEDWRDAERAMDQVSARFGSGALGPASLARRIPGPDR